MPLNTALDAVGENRMLAVWAGLLRRHPAQANRMHEADAELVPIPGTDRLLAVTTDTVAEEIALGFYTDAETIGWVAATASLSDLAAVGAEPMGLVSAVTLPRTSSRDFAAGLAVGLDAAARAAGTYVLGGDTNLGDVAAVTTTAFGTVPRARAMMRTRCRAGETAYCSGPLGAGALPVMRALGADVGGAFRPEARLREARVIAGFASACMDTSDGLVATLDQLSRLNGVGFEIRAPLEEVLLPAVRAACERMGLDPLLALAQPHGEFELVFTVPADATIRFEARARDQGLAPVRLGVTTVEPGLRFAGEPPRTLDGARIRNLLDEVGGDPRRYAMALAEVLRQS